MLALLAITLSLSVLSVESRAQFLTFDEALSISLSENHAIRASERQVDVAYAERRAAIGLRMPQISAVGAYAWLGDDVDFDMNHLKPAAQGLAGNLLSSGIVPPAQFPTLQGLLGPMLAADWSLTLQQRSTGFVGGEVVVPIWMGGKINAANRVVRLNLQTALSEKDHARSEVTTELVTRYFGVALSREVVRVRRQVVEAVEHHLSDAEALERNGMIARSERLYVEVKLSEARRDLLSSELALQTSEAALRTTLGTTLALQPVTPMFIVDAIRPLADYLDMAQAANPLLEQIDIKHRLAHEALRVSRAEFLPEVVAMGGGSVYNYQVSGLVPRWAVGVGVKIKLFDGLRRENKYKAAIRTEQRVGELQREASQGVSLLVEQLYNRLCDCRNRAASIDSSLEFTEEYLRTREIAFREGAGSATDVMDARTALAAVHIERLQAAYEFDMALSELLAAVGASDKFTEYMHHSSSREVVYNE